MADRVLRGTPGRLERAEIQEQKSKRPRETGIRTRGPNSPLAALFRELGDTGASRGNLEESDVPEQCRAVIGPPTKDTRCWLCGFLINGMSSGDFLHSKFLDSPVCEHVLPIRLAYLITGLHTEYGLPGIGGNLDLLHTEYEYAHHYCNFVKSKIWFITKGDSNEDWCGLNVNSDKVDRFLEKIYSGNRSPLGPPLDRNTGEVSKHESGIFRVDSATNKVTRVYENIVDCYVNELKGGDKDGWKARQKQRILAKCSGLINKIKDRDGCGTDKPGQLYAEAMSRRYNIQRFGSAAPYYGPMSVPVARTSSFQQAYSNNSEEIHNEMTNNRSAPGFLAPIRIPPTINEVSYNNNNTNTNVNVNRPPAKRGRTVKNLASRYAPGSTSAFPPVFFVSDKKPVKRKKKALTYKKKKAKKFVPKALKSLVSIFE